MDDSFASDFSSFAYEISHTTEDIDGDGNIEVLTSSSKGLFLYSSYENEIISDPSLYFGGDDYLNTTKVLLMNYGVVYCNSVSDDGYCGIFEF